MLNVFDSCPLASIFPIFLGNFLTVSLKLVGMEEEGGQECCGGIQFVGKRKSMVKVWFSKSLDILFVEFSKSSLFHLPNNLLFSLCFNLFNRKDINISDKFYRKLGSRIIFSEFAYLN